MAEVKEITENISMFKVMHQQGNLAFGQVNVNQVYDKCERNRDGQEKSGRLI